MSKINIGTNVLIALWKFTIGNKKTDSFIQKTLKVFKIFKEKSMKRLKFDVPPKETA